ncbi:UNVERIFIED_CONTAM: hypothetical protein OHV15_12795 [Microbacterium sp. SLM126]
MRRSPFAAALPVVVAVVLTLAGCAAPAPVETPAASPTSEPSATPTIEPIVIGPAEMPPVPFDGDCAKMLSIDELAGTLGESVEFEWAGTDAKGKSTGALHCSWRVGESDSMSATVIPRAGLDGAALSPDLEDFYFAECDSHVCSWQGGDDRVWVGLDFRAAGLTREVVDSWGDDLGSRIVARYGASAAEPWIRGRTGWWPALDCAHIAKVIGAQLGETLTGDEMGWEDAPSPWYALVDQALRSTDCVLQLQDTDVNLSTSPGTGIDQWDALRWTAQDLGIPGIEGFKSDQQRVSDYALTDGINSVLLQIYSGDGDTVAPRDIAVAVAAAAASDFQ